MIRIAATLLVLSLAACAAAPAPAPAGCDVTIKFGSYGMGIDRDLADRVATAVKDDRDVARSERRPWGREGEYDLCLSAKPGRGAAVYDRYRAMLPVQSLKAPTSIEGPDGLRFESIGPM
ncbi:hypothetical protein [Caulobacter sp. RHG1]|uniref:hypothetical protein n=1 Tax=Caulobacter sp. (strain RHG1) TaxID=2545762 RepID=UPI001553B820|nr:hypothetical protein [Caulobacter sp. RHG1]NQE63385.1 hypothetical protein [Caulobacter sp. RHG1]